MGSEKTADLCIAKCCDVRSEETQYQSLNKADNILLRLLATPALFFTQIPGGQKNECELFDLSKES